MEIISAKKRIAEEKAIELIEQRVKELGKKNEIILGITGGRSVQGIYKKFIKAEIPWNKIHIFMVDERCVPVMSEESNYRMARELFMNELVNSGKLSENNVHPFRFSHGENQTAVARYQEEFEKYAKAFDIVILGAGEDGHVASLFPNHSILNDSRGFIFVKKSPKPPNERITASRKLLQASDTSFLLFFGKGKKQAYRNFRDNDVSLSDCPAKLVQIIKNSYVLTNISKIEVL